MKKQLQKIAFLDRDGTLIYEPLDTKQVDSPDLLRILPGVIPELQSLQRQGYALVMVSNQDGVGTEAFPKEAFDAVQRKLLEDFRVNEIAFDGIFICPHLETDGCACRKPQTGLLKEFLAGINLGIKASFLIGDRESDRLLARNIGVRFFPMETNGTFPKLS